MKPWLTIVTVLILFLLNNCGNSNPSSDDPDKKLIPSIGPKIIGDNIRYTSLKYTLRGSNNLTYVYVDSWCDGSSLRFITDTTNLTYSVQGDTLTMRNLLMSSDPMVFIRNSEGSDFLGVWKPLYVTDFDFFIYDSSYIVVTDTTIENWGPTSVYLTHLDSTFHFWESLFTADRFNVTQETRRLTISDKTKSDAISLTLRDDLLLQWESSEPLIVPYKVHGIPSLEQPQECSDVFEETPDWLLEFISRQ